MASLDLRARGVVAECSKGSFRWQTIRPGKIERLGFMQLAGSRCTFPLSLDGPAALSLRADLFPSGSSHGGEIGIRILVALAGNDQLIHEMAFSGVPPRTIELTDHALPAGTRALVTEVVGGGPRNVRVGWSDLRLTTAQRGSLDPALWSIPVGAAIADFLAERALERGQEAAREGSRKLLVIGLDGASWPLLDALIAEGSLPNFAALEARGRRGVLESTIIPESAMAWTSIRTGVGPGKHGVIHFIARDGARSSYWRWLSDAGLRSVVIGVPKSRASEEFDGILVGGWDLTAEQSYARPKEVEAALERAHYDPHIVNLRNEGYFAERMRTRTELARALLGGTDWDHAFVVYEYTDTAGHVFGLHSDGWRRTYSTADAELGRLLEVVDAETTLLLVSDHGWQRYAGSFAPEAWMKAQDLDPWVPYIYGGSRFSLRTSTRDQRGAENEAEAFAEIAKRLEAVVEPKTGRKLFRRIIPASEAFPGPFAEDLDARAIVELVPDWHAAAKSSRERAVLAEPIDHHATEGFYLLIGPGVEPGAGRRGSVLDVAPTVADFYGAPRPADLDGSPLWPFAPASEPVAVFTETPAQQRSREEAVTPTRELEESLRALGYIDE